jgi:hypothetical protein
VIGIVQVSDIHFRSGINTASGKIQQIKGAVQGEIQEITDLLLILSGDMAFSGLQTEYSIALDFVVELEKALQSVPNVNFLGTVVVPGNHDCDFSNEGHVRPALLTTIPDNIASIEANDDRAEQMLGVQESFFAFEALVSNSRALKDKLFWFREFSSSAGKILVRCFNTAWISRKEEKAAQILFPIQIVPDISGTDAALVVSVFHHPYGWLQPDNARAFRRLIETSSDVVFTGHEHDGDAYTRVSSTSKVNYVEGLALQSSGVTTGFNFCKLDLPGQAYSVREFQWDGNHFTAGKFATAIFTRNQALLEHQFLNNPEFAAYLDDVGTPFSHPVKTQLRLSDLYCYPDLRIATVTPKGSGEVIVVSKEVLDYVTAKPRLCIAGPSTSGKTSLAKTLYGDFLRRKQLVPILLQAEDIRGAGPAQVQSSVNRAFERQYAKRLLEKFNQLDSQSRVAIIDDWHAVSNLNARGRALVLEYLGSKFGHVIVFTDDASVLHQMAEAMAARGISGFEYCEIRQFGFRLRGELITKWETLGREFEVEELELTHRISEDEYLLDTLISKGIAPAFPFFMFSILQARELATSNSSYGSYGHIYQALLTTRMAKVNPKNLGLKFRYLSMIAFEMFQTGQDTITAAQLRMIHQKYEKEYMNTTDQAKLLSELEEGQVLAHVGDLIRFKYKYGYYYFVAEYLHDGISNVKDAEALRRKLKELADNAYS